MLQLQCVSLACLQSLRQWSKWRKWIYLCNHETSEGIFCIGLDALGGGFSISLPTYQKSPLNMHRCWRSWPFFGSWIINEVKGRGIWLIPQRVTYPGGGNLAYPSKGLDNGRGDLVHPCKGYILQGGFSVFLQRVPVDYWIGWGEGREYPHTQKLFQHGTWWNVVSVCCMCCIKINFT